MVNSGFGGPQGRRQRRSVRRHSVDRALSASALLPTFAFAALGTVTVLLVAQMSISQLDAVVGPSAHDGGHAVTTPRMSVSIDVSRLLSLRSMSSRDASRVSGTEAVGREVVAAVTPPRPGQAAFVAMASPVASPEVPPERAHGRSRAAEHATKTSSLVKEAKAATRAVENKHVKHVPAHRAKPLRAAKIPA